MVVDVISGHSAALSRALNAAAKKRGDRRRWSDADVAELASDAASLSAVMAGIKSLGACESDTGKVRRGRRPRASSDEIATEMARIKAAAAQARQQARSLDRRLRRPDRTARRLAIAALFATGNPARKTLIQNGPVSREQTTVKAHRSTAGGKKGAQSRALGRLRGGRTTKIHALSDAEWRPLVLMLTGGQVADCTGAALLQ